MYNTQTHTHIHDIRELNESFGFPNEPVGVNCKFEDEYRLINYYKRTKCRTTIIPIRFIHFLSLVYDWFSGIKFHCDTKISL